MLATILSCCISSLKQAITENGLKQGHLSQFHYESLLRKVYSRDTRHLNNQSILYSAALWFFHCGLALSGCVFMIDFNLICFLLSVYNDLSTDLIILRFALGYVAMHRPNINPPILHKIT